MNFAKDSMKMKSSGRLNIRSLRIRTWRKLMLPYLFILPIFTLCTIFYLFPIGLAVFLSLHKWMITLGTEPTFIGFKNYLELFNDFYFKKSLWNTLYFTVGRVPVELCIALGLALLLDQKLKFRTGFRAIFFLPVIISMVVVSLLWKFMFDPYTGAINYFLIQLGLKPQGWLTNPKTAMSAIIITTIWKGTGYEMVILLAGLQGIPRMFYEAALIDGANRWNCFRFVTLPLLKPAILFALIMMSISSFLVFSQIFVMTSGGPAFSTTTLVYNIWLNAFEFFNMGYASALACVLFLITIVTAGIQLKVFQ